MHNSDWIFTAGQITSEGDFLCRRGNRRKCSCDFGMRDYDRQETCEVAASRQCALGGAKKDGRIYDYPYRIRIPQRIAITQTQSNCLARSFTHIHAAKHVVSG